jgi:hypothetical protein
MSGLTQGFPIKEILLVKIDLRELIQAGLDLDPAGGAGGIAPAVVIHGKPKCFGRLQK